MNKIQPYNLKVEFRSRKSIPAADFLSRNYVQQSGKLFLEIENHVQIIKKSWDISNRNLNATKAVVIDNF